MTHGTEVGTKHDQGKPQLGLIDGDFLIGMGEVLTFGANKYGKHNWRNGIHTSRLVDATLRHFVSYMRGVDLDEESGMEHLYHAACCIMMLSVLSGSQWDDRVA